MVGGRGRGHVYLANNALSGRLAAAGAGEGISEPPVANVPARGSDQLSFRLSDTISLLVAALFSLSARRRKPG